MQQGCVTSQYTVYVMMSILQQLNHLASSNKRIILMCVCVRPDGRHSIAISDLHARIQRH